MSIWRPKNVGLHLNTRLPRKVKLAGSLGIRHLSSEGPCLTHYISAVYRAIPDIFQVWIVRRKVYKNIKNRLSTSENDATAEGQTCWIARFTTLIVRKTMFDSLYRGR